MSEVGAPFVRTFVPLAVVHTFGSSTMPAWTVYVSLGSMSAFS